MWLNSYPKAYHPSYFSTCSKLNSLPRKWSFQYFFNSIVQLYLTSTDLIQSYQSFLYTSYNNKLQNKTLENTVPTVCVYHAPFLAELWCHKSCLFSLLNYNCLTKFGWPLCAAHLSSPADIPPLPCSFLAPSLWSCATSTCAFVSWRFTIAIARSS